ncbi:flagellar hook-basal body protein [Asticcacaulis solisilvae]|uniref:flagellar hook-basal body protein n=1 Tax=Asticcacaulis solisilvae TaxID=1217274 RepID=UPI003FD84277
MNGVFYIGATGLDTQQRALDIVANNIANLNTRAFKQSHPQFSQMVAPVALPADGHETSAADAQAAMLGVKLDGAPVDFTQGQLNATGAPLDLAINGSGFIELMGPGGQTMLWRGGGLMVNPDGYLAASNGMPLQAMISVPHDASALTISADGKVTATVDGSAQPVSLGQIELSQDNDPSTLTAIGGGLYVPQSDADIVRAAPGTEGAGVLAQGFSEASNVDLSREMVTLLLMQRTYSANAQVVQAGDQLMGIDNELKR